jgi:hypothetical protein
VSNTPFIRNRNVGVTLQYGVLRLERQLDLESAGTIRFIVALNLTSTQTHTQLCTQ